MVATTSRLAHEPMNQPTGQTFRQWAGILDILDNGYTVHPDGETNVGSFMPLADFEDILSVHFSTQKKIQDPDKIIPRGCRLDAICAELKNPGTIAKPQGFDYNKDEDRKEEKKRDNAQWAYYVKNNFQLGQERTDNESIFQLPGFIYSKSKPPTQKAIQDAIEAGEEIPNEKQDVVACYKKWSPDGTPRFQAPVTAVEMAYNHFIWAHVYSEWNEKEKKQKFVHRGRDATYAHLMMGKSSSITKQLVAKLSAACTTCTPRVEKSRLAAAEAEPKRANKRKAKNAGNSPTAKRQATKKSTSQLQLSHPFGYNATAPSTYNTYTPQPQLHQSAEDNGFAHNLDNIFLPHVPQPFGCNASAPNTYNSYTPQSQWDQFAEDNAFAPNFPEYYSNDTQLSQPYGDNDFTSQLELSQPAEDNYFCTPIDIETIAYHTQQPNFDFDPEIDGFYSSSESRMQSTDIARDNFSDQVETIPEQPIQTNDTPADDDHAMHPSSSISSSSGLEFQERFPPLCPRCSLAVCQCNENSISKGPKISSMGGFYDEMLPALCLSCFLQCSGECSEPQMLGIGANTPEAQSQSTDSSGDNQTPNIDPQLATDNDASHQVETTPEQPTQTNSSNLEKESSDLPSLLKELFGEDEADEPDLEADMWDQYATGKFD